MDGNGTPELVIADSDGNDGGPWRGAIWIVFLDKDLGVQRTQKISNWRGGFDGPLRDHSGFGMSLAGPGDVDGDGVPDLLVGSAKRVWTLFLNADGRVRQHIETALGDKPSGAQMGFGTSIACSPFARPGLTPEFLALGGSEPQTAALWWLRLGLDGKLYPR